MTQHSFLFFVEQKQVFRYLYRDNGRFDLVPYSDGEKGKIVTPEFWPEWEENSCYAPDDFVDFAFLTDNSFGLEMPSGYKVLNPTQFCTYKRIQDIFCKRTLDYPNVKLVYKGREEHVLSQRNLLDDELRTFYLTIPYPAPQDLLSSQRDDGYCLGSFIEEERNVQQQKIDKMHKRDLQK